MATPQAILQVAQQVANRKCLGQQLVVVVSAMGDTTDLLLALAHQISPTPNGRELAMLTSVGERITMALLAMALEQLACPAISLTGSQSGIITTPGPQHSDILEIRTGRILRALEQDLVVVVAGFQGMNKAGEITTLARGGSDTTAVALACALGADQCEIFSDVPGILSADPRKCHQAHLLPHIDYPTMSTMAHLGAQVLHRHALSHGQAGKMPIVCQATHGDPLGQTRIDSRPVAIPGPLAVHAQTTCQVLSWDPEHPLEAEQQDFSLPSPLLHLVQQHHWVLLWQTDRMAVLDGKDASMPWQEDWLAPWPTLLATPCGVVSVIGMNLLQHGSQLWLDWLSAQGTYVVPIRSQVAPSTSHPAVSTMGETQAKSVEPLSYHHPLLTHQFVAWLVRPEDGTRWLELAHHYWCDMQDWAQYAPRPIPGPMEKPSSLGSEMI